MESDLTEVCGVCANARALAVQVNNAAGGCYFLGWLHQGPGDKSREHKSAFNGPLEVVCHTCGNKGRVLTRRGMELVELVRSQIASMSGKWPDQEQAIKATLAVALELEESERVTGEIPF